MFLSTDVRKKALILASRDRLFVQDAEGESLRPASGPDVLDVFEQGQGSLYVVTRQGVTTSHQEQENLRLQGFRGWSQSLNYVQANSTRQMAQYTAVPILDVDDFCAVPLADRQGRPLEGLPVETLRVGRGTVELSGEDRKQSIRMFQEHFWAGSSSAHRYTTNQTSGRICDG